MVEVRTVASSVADSSPWATDQSSQPCSVSRLTNLPNSWASRVPKRSCESTMIQSIDPASTARKSLWNSGRFAARSRLPVSSDQDSIINACRAAQRLMASLCLAVSCLSRETLR